MWNSPHDSRGRSETRPQSSGGCAHGTSGRVGGRRRRRRDGSGTASAAPTGIDECTTIDEPGTYALTANVSPDELGDRESCVSIRADDVTLDGNGHAVDTTDVEMRRPAAVGTNGSARVENVTVRD